MMRLDCQLASLFSDLAEALMSNQMRAEYLIGRSDKLYDLQ